jgi:hypothetical protein
MRAFSVAHAGSAFPAAVVVDPTDAVESKPVEPSAQAATESAPRAASASLIDVLVMALLIMAGSLGGAESRLLPLAF